MIGPDWRRIAAIHVEDDGTIAAVWIAQDPETHALWVYDCCKFTREVLAVVGQGLNTRGRNIPIAWEQSGKAIANQLLDFGCKMIPEQDVVKETQALAEVRSREINERMRSQSFLVEKRLREWEIEANAFYHHEAKVPLTGFPLMSATRYAVANLDYARRLKPRGRPQVNFPQVSIV